MRMLTGGVDVLEKFGMGQGVKSMDVVGLRMTNFLIKYDTKTNTVNTKFYKIIKSALESPITFIKVGQNTECPGTGSN